MEGLRHVALLVGALAASSGPTPGAKGAPVLLVQTPGFSSQALAAAEEALVHHGFSVTSLRLPCAELSLDHLGQLVDEARTDLGPQTPVVAHGLGATVALWSTRNDPTARLALLSPVVGAPFSAATEAYLDSTPEAWDVHNQDPWVGRTLHEVVFGPTLAPEGCIPPALHPLLHTPRAGRWNTLVGQQEQVWVGLAVGDVFSPIENQLPALQARDNVDVHWAGWNRLYTRNFSHTEILHDPATLRRLSRVTEAP